MGRTPRGYADDADPGGGHASAFAARPARHERGRGNLSAAFAAFIDVRGGNAKAVRRTGALSWHGRHQDAVYHRRRGLGRRR